MRKVPGWNLGRNIVNMSRIPDVYNQILIRYMIDCEKVNQFF
jgi:hypothetical protein